MLSPIRIDARGPHAPSEYSRAQRGENYISEDGKEIAEAEDWESTVKENRVRT